MPVQLSFIYVIYIQSDISVITSITDPEVTPSTSPAPIIIVYVTSAASAIRACKNNSPAAPWLQAHCSSSNVSGSAYFNYIIGILKQNNKNSEAIKHAIINRIEKIT